MQFLYPTFLWALGALAIPIIIHLFHFRRFKKVYFTNVHLLKELKEETSTRNKLRNLLILLARCAAIAMLVFAFAQPLIKSGDVDDAQKRAVELIIDNSFSMEARQTEVPLLTLAKDRAREIVSSYDESDTYLVLTHDLQAKHLRYVDQKTALDFIDELRITPNVEQLSDIYEVSKRIRRNITDHSHQVYLLSDFQSNISEFETPIDSSINVNLIPFRAIQESNVAIVGAAWEAPIAMKDQPNRLVVKLHNYGDEQEAVELRMNFEGQERPLGSVNITANSDAIDTVSVPITKTGWHNLTLSINDFPVEFDNELYTSFNIKEKIDVASIYDNAQNQYLKSAFESISYYNLIQQPKNGIRYESFQNQELIILDDLTDISSGLTNELVKYVKGGGNLLIFPSVNANKGDYNNLLGALKTDRLGALQTGKKDVARINTDEFVFSEVYLSTRRNIRLPSSNSNYQLTSASNIGKERLLSYRDGSPFLQKFTIEKGNVYLCVAPMSDAQNDLVRNAEVFVPMLYKMALSAGTRSPLFYTIGEDDVIPLSTLADASSERYVIKGKTEFIPAITSAGQVGYMDIRGQVEEQGFYNLTLEDKTIESLSFNYNRQESDVSYGSMSDIASRMGDHVEVLDNVALANLSGYISEKNDGIRLWRWCLIGALLFLLLEIGLIRLWK